MAQWSGAFTVLAEDPGRFPAPTPPSSTPVPQDMTPTFGLSEHIMYMLYIHRCRQTFIHVNTKTFLNKRSDAKSLCVYVCSHLSRSSYQEAFQLMIQGL